MAPCKRRLALRGHLGPTVSDPTFCTRGIMFNQLSLFARSFALGVLLGTVSLPAAAADSQADELAQLKTQLNQSVEMIRALAARVHELEAKQGREAAGSATAAAAPAPQAPPATPVDAQRLEAVEPQINHTETPTTTP